MKRLVDGVVPGCVDRQARARVVVVWRVVMVSYGPGQSSEAECAGLSSRLRRHASAGLDGCWVVGRSGTG